MNAEGSDRESSRLTDAPANCGLAACALLTSYDRPDPRFLVEHMLPLLLRVDRESDSEGIERQYFFGELTRRLEALHGQIVVASSTSQTEDVVQDYPWLWRFVRPLAVGRTGKSVQHAKLWMFHWATEDKDHEYLEVVRFLGESDTIRAEGANPKGVGCVCLPLADRGSMTRRDAWGILPAFLRELGTSCNEEAALTPFVDMLARAECPPHTDFIASVPGRHTRNVLKRTPGRRRALAGIALPGKGRIVASVLAPYVGTWDVAGLTQWCSSFGGEPSNLELVWIDADHPWARGNYWVLPKKTLRALAEGGCDVLHLRYWADEHDDDVVRFHEAHRGGDDRWSHSKAYQFRRGKAHRLLVTSANFSAAAWGRPDGDGGLVIENFELGVCVRAEPWAFADLTAFEDFKRISTVSEEPNSSSPSIVWASASWDGKRVHVECRLADAELSVTAAAQADEQQQELGNWDSQPASNIRTAGVLWSDAKHPPQVVILTSGDESLAVPVFDARGRGERMTTPVPEVDEDLAELMRDELLFEQYGGGVAVPDSTSSSDDDESDVAPDPDVVRDGVDDPEDEASAANDSYAVATFEHARTSLDIVDTWASRVADALAAKHDGRLLYEDGKALFAAFERQMQRFGGKSAATALGPRLAAEETSVAAQPHRGRVMTIEKLGLTAISWQFLSKPQDYVDRSQQTERPLVVESTRRQFRTAKDILERLNGSHGQPAIRGLLLADDVGLGKTTVAALVAWVVASAGEKRNVRVLAPNDVMKRRWEDELALHVPLLNHCAPHFQARTDRIKRGNVVQRLAAGAIQVVKHSYAAKDFNLACDLLIVDEAHRAKGEKTAFSEALKKQKKHARRVLILTATPFQHPDRGTAKDAPSNRCR